MLYRDTCHFVFQHDHLKPFLLQLSDLISRWHFCWLHIPTFTLPPEHSHLSLTQQGETAGNKVAYWWILILWYISELRAEIGDQAAAPKIPDTVTDDGVDLISAPDSDCQSWAAEEATKSDRLRLTMNQDYRPGSLSVQHNLQNHCKIKSFQAALPQSRPPPLLFMSLFSSIWICTYLICRFFHQFKVLKSRASRPVYRSGDNVSHQQRQRQIFRLEISHQASDVPKRGTEFDLAILQNSLT